MQLTLRYHVVSASGCHLSSVSTPRTRPQFVHAPHRVCRMQVRPTATLAAAPSIGTNAPSMEPVQEPSVVRDIASAESFQDIVANSGDKLVVLMCKASRCRPCKVFKPKYEQLANVFSDGAFYSVVGDRNDSTRQLMRDYKVRATPTFMFFRNGKQVHSHSGVNADNMMAALQATLKDGETGDFRTAADILKKDKVEN